MDIETIRNEIDEIDKQILDLFISRMDLCKKIAKIKKDNNQSITSLERESNILSRVAEYSKEYSNEALILFKDIIAISKNIQKEYIKSNL